jgi:succinyl-CoA synthetase alpha subunit
VIHPGGVTGGKAGTTDDVDGTEVPVFGTVAEAMEKTGADVSLVFVPPAFTKAAALEAVDAENNLDKGAKTRIIGPNCPGLISPGSSNAGIIPANITKAGKIGLVSKSGTLTYQMR